MKTSIDGNNILNIKILFQRHRLQVSAENNNGGVNSGTLTVMKADASALPVERPTKKTLIGRLFCVNSVGRKVFTSSVDN